MLFTLEISQMVDLDCDLDSVNTFRLITGHWQDTFTKIWPRVPVMNVAPPLNTFSKSQWRSSTSCSKGRVSLYSNQNGKNPDDFRRCFSLDMWKRYLSGNLAPSLSSNGRVSLSSGGVKWKKMMVFHHNCSRTFQIWNAQIIPYYTQSFAGQNSICQFLVYHFLRI